MLTKEEILLLLDRLKWESVYRDRDIILCRAAGIGYSDDPTLARIQGKLSIMLSVTK